MKKHNQTPKKGDLKVWWIPQIPMKPFHVSVANIDEAAKILYVLAEYDLFQYDNKVKPDYSNAGGLEVFDGNEWTEWESDEYEDIDEYMESKEER